MGGKIWTAVELAAASAALYWSAIPVWGQFALLAMCFDIATGVVKAGRAGVWSPSEMKRGLWLKGGIALLLVALFWGERSTGIGFGSAMAAAYGFREIGSGLQNLGEAGVWIPNFLTDSILSLRSRFEAEFSRKGSEATSKIAGDAGTDSADSEVDQNKKLEGGD